MAKVTMRDVLMAAAPIAAAQIAQPANAIMKGDSWSIQCALREAMDAVEAVLEEKNIEIADHPLQEAVLNANSS